MKLKVKKTIEEIFEVKLQDGGIGLQLNVSNGGNYLTIAHLNKRGHFRVYLDNIIALNLTRVDVFNEIKCLWSSSDYK